MLTQVTHHDQLRSQIQSWVATLTLWLLIRSLTTTEIFRLLNCIFLVVVINYSFVNQFENNAYYSWLKDFSFWKILLIKIVLFNILKNSFNTYLNWLFSWFFYLNLDSWLNDSLILKTCFDWTTLWFLKLVWLLILDLSLWHPQNNLEKHCFHRIDSKFKVFYN